MNISLASIYKNIMINMHNFFVHRIEFFPSSLAVHAFGDPNKTSSKMDRNPLRRPHSNLLILIEISNKHALGNVRKSCFQLNIVNSISRFLSSFHWAGELGV